MPWRHGRLDVVLKAELARALQVRNGHTEMVEVLVAAGSNLKVQNLLEQTPVCRRPSPIAQTVAWAHPTDSRMRRGRSLLVQESSSARLCCCAVEQLAICSVDCRWIWLKSANAPI